MCEFLSWAEDSEELIEVIGIDRYAELFSIEFSEVYALSDLEKVIYELYKDSSLGMENEKLLLIVESIVDGSYDPISGCRILARLHSFEKGYDFIPVAFVGYDSVIEDLGCHYEEDARKEEIERITDLYKIDIINTAQEFLEIIKCNPNILKKQASR